MLTIKLKAITRLTFQSFCDNWSGREVDLAKSKSEAEIFRRLRLAITVVIHTSEIWRATHLNGGDVCKPEAVAGAGKMLRDGTCIGWYECSICVHTAARNCGEGFCAQKA